MHRIMRRVAEIKSSDDREFLESDAETQQKSKRLVVCQRMLHRYLGSAYGSAESVTATEFEGKDKDENSGFDKLDTGAIAFLSSDLRSLPQHPSLIEKPSVESTGANIAFGGKEFMDYTSLCLTKAWDRFSKDTRVRLVSESNVGGMEEV